MYQLYRAADRTSPPAPVIAQAGRTRGLKLIVRPQGRADGGGCWGGGTAAGGAPGVAPGAPAGPEGAAAGGCCGAEGARTGPGCCGAVSPSGLPVGASGARTLPA